jgi:dihydropteroate synthase-like protein
MTKTVEHLHFVTGKLAASALQRLVTDLGHRYGFDYSIDVLPISVAALMTVDWVGPRIRLPEGVTRIVLPGYCRGDLEPWASKSGIPWERGPKDLRCLPKMFGAHPERNAAYSEFNIEIIAEINHAPRWPLKDFVSEARRLADDGADIIDVGCEPGTEPWSFLGDYVRALRDLGLRVSVDSLNPLEISMAVAAGAELVLSVNNSNRQAALDWGCEVVAIPDDPGAQESLDGTIEFLESHGVIFRADPILEPIGFGFAASIARYMDFRKRYPELPLLMGIGNLTELTDVDSAGLNVLLLAICQELKVHSVLTTQVIPWARSAVRECDLARRLVYHAVHHGVLPKHVDDRLIVLRDTATHEYNEIELTELAQQIRDGNFRIFVAKGQVHVINRDGHVRGTDAFHVFDQILQCSQRPLEADHAFYLGYELCKAATALTLGKNYEQDQELRWGFLSTGGRE